MRVAVVIGLGVAMLGVGCGGTGSPRNNAALPDLNTVEECQRADLQRYWGKTYRFHLHGCEADVAFSARGEVLSFEPNDAALCERVLDACRP